MVICRAFATIIVSAWFAACTSHITVRNSRVVNVKEASEPQEPNPATPTTPETPAPPPGTPANPISRNASLSLMDNEPGEDVQIQAQGSVKSHRASLKYSGNAPLKFHALSHTGGAISFAGGQFPGTGGNCGFEIDSNCDVVLDVSVGQTLGQKEWAPRLTFKSVAGTVEVVVPIQTRTQFLHGLDAFNVNPFAPLQLSAPRDVWTDGTKLLVTDGSASRIFGWNTLPANREVPPDFVLGSPMTAFGGMLPLTVASSPSDDRNCHTPSGVVSDGTKIIVACPGQSRVLIWNQWPTSHNAKADVVLGQPDFISSTPNNGADPAAWMSSPRAVAILNGNLVVTDFNNHRVLIFDGIPTQNQAAAIRVIGQPNMTTVTSGLSAGKLYRPAGVTILGNYMFVADLGNNRVLRYPNETPSTYPVSSAAADLVLGQSAMNAGTANAGGAVDASTLNQPHALVAAGGSLYVADSVNNRVLRFFPAPTGNKPSAVQVFGYTSFTVNTDDDGAVTARSLDQPYGFSVAGNLVVIADRVNNRLTFYDNETPIDGPEAMFIWGQVDANSENASGAFVENDYRCEHAWIGRQDQKIAASCVYTHRTLIFNALPSSPRSSANYVIGQPDFTSQIMNAGGLSERSLRSPKKPMFRGNEIWIPDGGNNRILRYSNVTENFPAADLVVGQADFASAGANRGGAVAANTLSSPNSVTFSDDLMLVSDTGNHRVLIYNLPVTSGAAAAARVLGQADMTSSQANRGAPAPAANTLKSPQAAWTDGERVVVLDVGNNRVLIWNSFPTQDGQDADVVLGQLDFTSDKKNIDDGFTARADGLFSPLDAGFHGERLAVADRGNTRVLIWDSFPTTNGQPADRVLFQSDLTKRERGVSADRVSDVIGLSLGADDLIISDRGNYRLLGVPLQAVSTP